MESHIINQKPDNFIYRSSMLSVLPGILGKHRLLMLPAVFLDWRIILAHFHPG